MIAAAIMAIAAIGATASPRPVPLGALRSGTGHDAAGYSVSVEPGGRGLLDGVIRFTGGHGARSVHGFRVRVAGADLAAAGGPLPFEGVQMVTGSGGVTGRHRFRAGPGIIELVIALRLDRGVLAASIYLEGAPSSRPGHELRIEDAAIGAWDTTIERVYAGAGNVIVRPEAFTLGYDGHQLSTSFVGLEWVTGPAMLVATDAVPDRLRHDPAAMETAIHSPGPQTIRIVPGPTAFAALDVWRAAWVPPASPGFRALAGRFVFDLWGGTFAAAADALRWSFRHGLTDAVVIWHNWQRYGYDVRLPDIWPPRAEVGTAAEMKVLADMCRANGVLFAPHDNYIDYYPDAEGFGPESLCHDEAGKPVKAWLNSWANVPEPQSYRWRPDRVRPLIERNLALLKTGIAPTAYFTDVWSSLGPHDWRDRDGTFHPRSETRRLWGELFDLMRDRLDGAPQISESGHDALVGHLDGATANHLRVDAAVPAAQWFAWRVKCADSERVPWFDYAYHDRFALHGAGYEDRYAAGLDTRDHGVYSDDYLSTLVMTGRPAMVKDPTSPDAIRVYWLLHGVMRALAGQRISSVEFVGGDIHRQRIQWDGGGAAVINRGATDWEVDGIILPQFGFLIRVPGAGGPAEAAVHRVNGNRVERASWPGGRYLSARPSRPAIRVAAAKPGANGKDSFILPLTWDAGRATDRPMAVFVHCTDAAGRIVFQGDHALPVSSTRWAGTIRSEARVRIPATVSREARYAVGVGLWDPVGGGRAELAGADPEGQRRYRLGSIRFPAGGRLEWTPEPAADALRDPRRNPSGATVTWDGITTDGECRFIRAGGGMGETTVTPLPGSAPCRVTLHGRTHRIQPAPGEISVILYNDSP